jgi:hypothetical protein
MSDAIRSTPMSLVKLAVRPARGMLLTDTFKVLGRSAMMLEPSAGTGDAGIGSPGRPGIVARRPDPGYGRFSKETAA